MRQIVNIDAMAADALTKSMDGRKMELRIRMRPVCQRRPKNDLSFRLCRKDRRLGRIP